MHDLSNYTTMQYNYNKAIYFNARCISMYCTYEYLFKSQNILLSFVMYTITIYLLSKTYIIITK